ncbi:MAG: Ku protein [Pseudomonadota bacterium]
MPARPYWQGQIRLALVSIPVQVFTATKSGARVQFRQIHEPSGKPVKYEKVVPGIGPVDTDDILKGYEYEKGSYVLLKDADLDAVKLETKKTLSLSQFVDAGEIDPLYFEKPYYVVPADDLAEEAFIVLREALRRAKKVGLGQITIRGREYVVALKPCGRGILMETLRYADEVNKAAPYFREIPNDKPDSELLDLASALIDKKTAPFSASAFTDHYGAALKELVARKMKAKGGKVTPEDEDEPKRGGSNVIDLMAALKKSIERPGASDAPKKPAAKKAPAKKPAAKKRAA